MSNLTHSWVNFIYCNHMEEISDDEINKALEELVIWDVINHLEEKMEVLEDLEDIRPLTDKEQKEYDEINTTIHDLLDRVDDGGEE